MTVFRTALMSTARVLLLGVCLWTPWLAAALSSGSLIQETGGDVLYAANADAGTISRLSTDQPDNSLTRQIGKDIRTVALDERTHTLAATDYVGHQLVLLDSLTLKEKHRISLPYRPYGVLFDATRGWFWVTLNESAQLWAITPNGDIRQQHPTLPTPRGLALLKDGRLLMTHAMTGQISVWNTLGTVNQQQVIDLVEEQHTDEFISQGLPRLLDNIAVSPEEDEAWLPHVLWNFDHPFQFQSTVFPAVSVLRITTEGVTEVPGWRKQLFRQINLQDVRNRTQIVSNPHQAVFSPDGNKVVVTLAGSEDLLVFDRARSRTDTKKKRRSRRIGKQDQGGAQAVQLLRDYPGRQPTGIVATGEHLYVQNRQSLNITQLTSGFDSPFARVQVAQAEFARIDEFDRLTPNQRAGSRLFHLGNTEESSDLPMTGDFWMSCASCHQDGFNATNKFLMNAHQQPSHANAITGHANLKSMIGLGFVGDYIRIIQDTQGGLGHDDRDGAPQSDPDAPDPALVPRMNALHAYVRLPENLPFVSTWLRLDDDRPVLHQEEWISSAACADCHKDMFEQWADSNHRLMGESNPYYRVLEDVAGQTEGEAFRTWCVGCHNPQRVSVGLPFRGQGNHMFEKAGQNLRQRFENRVYDLDEGTGCLFCHRITKLEDAGGNSGYTINLKDREQYLGESSNLALARWFGDRQINARPEVHAASYSQPFYKDPLYCKGCHDEFSPAHGAKIVSTYVEWENSSYNNPDDPSKHRTCIDCHMHADIARIGESIPGKSTEGGSTKTNVVTHQFTGANHHLVGLRNPKLEEMSIALLKTSAHISQRLEDNTLIVRVDNTGAGHALPTGVADFRQLWLQIEIKDAGGNTVFEHGTPNEQGHLPTDTRLFMKVFGDKEGKPVNLIFWRYAKLLSDTRIPADGYREEAFVLPANLAGPITVSTRLNFRIYPQWVTDAVQQKVPQLPDPPVVELNRIESSWSTL